ncbi:MAG: hypothetical protein KGH71_04075 [Candidatus Micrarchaeota archaeon]|nr:hypothetical protein [Candidatus Micrarchaeota archaeon]
MEKTRKIANDSVDTKMIRMTPKLEKEFDSLKSALKENYLRPIPTMTNYGFGSMEGGLPTGRFAELLSELVLTAEGVAGTERAIELNDALKLLIKQHSFRVCLQLREEIEDLGTYEGSEDYLAIYSELLEVFSSKHFITFARFLEPKGRSSLGEDTHSQEEQLASAVLGTVSSIASITGMSNPKATLDLLREMNKPSFNQGITAAEHMLHAINYMQLLRIEGESPVPMMALFSRILNSFRYDRLESELGDKEKIKRIIRDRETIELSTKKVGGPD